MTQVKLGAKPPEFQARPLMRVPFDGPITQITTGLTAPTAWYKPEASRRTDGIKPHFSNGVPVAPGPKVYIWGLLKPKQVSRFQKASTMDGTVKLASTVPDMSYTPTSADLARTTHYIDTREQQPPSRYY